MERKLEEQIQDEEQWIDYLEDELEPSLMEDMSKILDKDEVAQKVLKEYSSIKECLLSDDPAETLLPKIDLNQIHNKIMSEIVQTEIHSPWRLKVFTVQNLSMLMLAFVMMFSWVSVNKNYSEFERARQLQTVNSDFTNIIESNGIEDLSVTTDTILTHEDEMDFIVMGPTNKIDLITEEEMDEMVKSL